MSRIARIGDLIAGTSAAALLFLWNIIEALWLLFMMAGAVLVLAFLWVLKQLRVWK